VQMLAAIRKKFARAESVLAFSRNNPSTSPAITILVDLLAALVDRFNILIQLRGERANESVTATGRHEKIRHQLRAGLLRLFARPGMAAARTEPRLEEQFRRIRPGVARVDFLAGARSLVAATKQHVELLAKHGVTPELVDEASALLDAYETTVEHGVQA